MLLGGVIRGLKRSPNDGNNNTFNGLNGGIIFSASPPYTNK